RSSWVTSVITGYLGMALRCAPFARQWATCGERSCAVAARVTTCRGVAACDALSRGGFRRLAFVILILSCASASSPKVGAGCGNAARPDLWRGREQSRSLLRLGMGKHNSGRSGFATEPREIE